MGSGALEEDPPPLRVRAFFGLPVPEPQREELGRFIAACRQVAPAFRWTPKENLHLTIRFVGNVERSVVEAIADGLAGRPLAGFELALDGIGTFGSGGAVRVVWIGLGEGSDWAGALAAQVEAECSRVGLVGEERPFQAHMTLGRARVRGGSKLPDLPAAPHLNPWRADKLILYSSRLTKTGATYEGLKTLPLTR
jgi:RNA 2',3'-cyclic 3'-phosphodiesterase